MSDKDEMFEGFLALSAALTGYSSFRLLGTGQAKAYYDTLMTIAGDKTVTGLIGTYATIQLAVGSDRTAEADLLRARILSDDRFGPLARNLIKLWYVGTWYELPAEWRDAYAVSPEDRTFVIAPDAYMEGLLWPTVGGNPSGAKGPGYGTWALPPNTGFTDE